MSVRSEMRLADAVIAHGTKHMEVADLLGKVEALTGEYERYREYATSYRNTLEDAIRVGRSVADPERDAADKAIAARDRWVRERLRVVPKIVADNILEYVVNKGVGHPSELPALAPPFPEFWVEARVVVPKSGTFDIGALFVASGSREHGWTYAIYGVQGVDGCSMGVADPIRVSVTPEGNVDEWDDLWLLSAPAEEGSEIDPRDGVTALLAAVSFLNCSNTQQILVRRPLRDKRFGSSKGPKPILTYRLIHVLADQKKVKSERFYKNGDEGTALHVCRGHFRTYTESAPLFGKYVGTLWVSAHARGSARHGVVQRDYKVHAKGVDV